MIVILYKELNTKKRYPGCLGLINNKTETGYIEFCKSFHNIITIENSKDIKLRSYTTDFEQALINALNNVDPYSISVGCFYHYTRNIKEKKNLDIK